MRCLAGLVFLSLIDISGGLAQSNLLNSVKNNPKEAISLCDRFRSFNSRGISAHSDEVKSEISAKKNLNKVDAEILSTYVIGLHCPEVN